MPFASHYRLTMSGHFGTTGAGVERFTYGINLAKFPAVIGSDGSGDAEGAEQPGSDIVQDLFTDAEGFHGGANAKISALAVLDEVKFAWIGANGKYTRDPVIKVSNTPGGGPAQMRPPQVALAVSLATQRRGPTGKGRFYLPMPVVNLEVETGLLSASDVGVVRSAAADFLLALGNLPGVDLFNLAPCVSSSKGYNTIVNGVRVGRALDTIRSRRTSLDESYTSVLALSFDG